MTAVAAFATTKDGQGSTTVCTAVGWQLADKYRVLMVDCDMSGSGNMADFLRAHTNGKHLGYGLGGNLVTPQMLMEQAVQHRVKKNLWLIAGVSGGCGPGVDDLLKRIRPALHMIQGFDAILLDFGACFAHPRLRSPKDVGTEIAQTAKRIFVVIQDNPVRLAGNINVLQAADLPHGEILLCTTRDRDMVEEARSALRSSLNLDVSGYIAWDQDRAKKAEDEATPMSAKTLVDQLQMEIFIRSESQAAEVSA